MIFEAYGAHVPIIVGLHVNIFIKGHVVTFILLFSFLVFSFIMFYSHFIDFFIILIEGCNWNYLFCYRCNWN